MFKQIVSIFDKPDIDLFASKINHKLSNYISWRPDPGAKAIDAFSINWLPTYNYCFPPFSIILKVLQKIQQDKAQAIVVVPYWTTQIWFPVFLAMLVDHPLIMTASLNILYFPVHPKTSRPLHPKLKLLVAHISVVTLTHKMFLQQQNIYSCLLEEFQPGEDTTVLQQWHDFHGREETNYLLPDVTSELKFFTELYEKGWQYSSITLAHSAIASAVMLKGYTTLLNDPLIKCFIKGVYHLRRPKPKHSSIWDADILLRYWQQIEDNSHLNLLELSKKVTTLLVLLHELRISTITTFGVNRIFMSNIFYPSELLKHD